MVHMSANIRAGAFIVVQILTLRIHYIIISKAAKVALPVKRSQVSKNAFIASPASVPVHAIVTMKSPSGPKSITHE